MLCDMYYTTTYSCIIFEGRGALSPAAPLNCRDPRIRHSPSRSLKPAIYTIKQHKQ